MVSKRKTHDFAAAQERPVTYHFSEAMGSLPMDISIAAVHG